jgi:hypothetical protein
MFLKLSSLKLSLNLAFMAHRVQVLNLMNITFHSGYLNSSCLQWGSPRIAELQDRLVRPIPMGWKKCLMYNDKKIMERRSSAGKRVGRNRIILDLKYYQSKKVGAEK